MGDIPAACYSENYSHCTGGNDAWWFITVVSEPPNYIWTRLLDTHTAGRSLYLRDKWSVLHRVEHLRKKYLFKKKKDCWHWKGNQKKRVEVELKLDGYERCAKSQHTHSYILPLHKKLPRSTSILILLALLLGRLRVHSQPTVLFFASLCVSFPFLTWHLARQPASHRDKRYDLTSLQCSTDREREPESQQEREREREGGIKEITPRRNAGEVRKKETEGWGGSIGGGRKFRKTRFILLSSVPIVTLSWLQMPPTQSLKPLCCHVLARHLKMNHW